MKIEKTSDDLCRYDFSEGKTIELKNLNTARLVLFVEVDSETKVVKNLVIEIEK